MHYIAQGKIQLVSLCLKCVESCGALLTCTLEAEAADKRSCSSVRGT